MKHIVFIAPGHGEGDPGAVSGNFKEHDLATLIAKAMQHYLEAAGVSVVYHPGVRDIPLRIRYQADIANNSGAVLAVQIHLNAWGLGVANGAECWTYAPGGRRNKWAVKMQAKLATRFKDRGVKHKHYTFLKTTKMAAVIVEAGFLTNRKDRVEASTHAYGIGRDLADATLVELGLPESGAVIEPDPVKPRPRFGDDRKYHILTRKSRWDNVAGVDESLRLARILLEQGESVEIELK